MDQETIQDFTINDIRQQPVMHPPEVRARQATLFKHLLEQTLTVRVLEQYKDVLDLDIQIAVCDTCSGRVKLEPSKWLVGMDFDSDTGVKLAFSKVDIAQTCAEIVTGTADCSHEEADPASRNVTSCRLVHLAAMSSNYLPLLQYLHSAGCDLNTVSTSYGDTPLTVAIHFNKPNIVRYFLSVNVEVNDPANKLSLCPLSLAVFYDSEEIVEMLLATGKVDVNICKDNHKQPLLISCVRMHPEFVEPLLKAGADPNISNMTGTTPLFYAVNTRELDVVKLLIKYGADVNYVNKQGDVALLVVVHREDVEMVKVLLEAGADPNLYMHEGNNSLLLMASDDGCLDIMSSLIKHGAKPDSPNDIGYTPLHIAAWNGHLKCVKLLLETGCLHDQRTKDGNTPLALAAHGNHLKVIEQLLPLGCDVNNSDKDMDTPLQYAAYNGMTRAVELFIEHGARPNSVNSVNATALWNAVYQKHKEVVKLLLVANVEMEGASVGINQHSQTDQVVHVFTEPRSPLWVATQQNTPDIALLLVTAGYDIRREKWLLDAAFPPQAVNVRLNNMLTQYAHSPPRLVAICRNYFRRAFKLEIKMKVEGLHIPETLKNYITLADMKYTVEEQKK